MKAVAVVLLLLPSLPLHELTSWFSERQLKQPQVQKAFASLNESAIVDEWIRLTEIPSPSGKEQARADYVRTELQKLGLSDIRTDEMLNVSGVRRGTGKGRSVAFAVQRWTIHRNGRLATATGRWRERGRMRRNLTE